jgi:hypothetical protein
MAQEALRPGGMFILEAYTPKQIAFGTGGPKLEALMLTESQLKSDFDRMEYVVLQEIERDVREGHPILFYLNVVVTRLQGFCTLGTLL